MVVLPIFLFAVFTDMSLIILYDTCCYCHSNPSHEPTLTTHLRRTPNPIYQSIQAGETVYTTPPKRFGDGVFHVMLMRRKYCSRFRLARVLLGYATGRHVDLPGLEWITCTAYQWIPDHPTASFNDLDGEVVERGMVEGAF